MSLSHTIGLEEQQPSTPPARKLQPPKAQPSGTVQYSTVAAHLSSNPRTSPADPPGTCRRWRPLYQNADDFVSCSKQPVGQAFSATRDLATLGSTAPRTRSGHQMSKQACSFLHDISVNSNANRSTVRFY
uniref:Uncharacterized protein n=1 Tax=Zea mays TaxID=4577 RepID=B7ZZA5_MAIZE|nr:unknown [Zea mays]